MKNRYTVIKICKNCMFPQGLYRLRDKETGWKIIIEDKRDVDCIKDYLIKKDEQIRSLEEQLKNAIVPKFKFGDYLYSGFECFGKIICGEGTVYAIQKNDNGSINYYLKTNDDDSFCEREEDCFLTMEEAHKRSEKLLAELEGDE